MMDEYDPARHDHHDAGLRDILIPMIDSMSTLTIVEHLDRTQRYEAADLHVSSLHYGCEYEIDWKSSLTGDKPNYVLNIGGPEKWTEREQRTQRPIMIVTDLETAEWWATAQHAPLLEPGHGSMEHKIFLRISEFPDLKERLL